MHAEHDTAGGFAESGASIAEPGFGVPARAPLAMPTRAIEVWTPVAIIGALARVVFMPILSARGIKADDRA